MWKYNPDAIKNLRENLRLSQERFGEKLGVSRQHIYQIESARFFPRVSTLEKVMEVFGVDPSFFFVDSIASMQMQSEINEIKDRAA